MDKDLHLRSWSEFPAEFMSYFGVMGFVHLALFGIGGLILAVLPIWQRNTLPRRVGRLGLFLGVLLVVGSVANGLWSCLVWGRLYESKDYLFEFSPFEPFTRRFNNDPFTDERRRLLGVSVLQMQLVWLLFTVGTWAITMLAYRFICRRMTTNKPPLHPTI